jgi:hypothetical protein
MEIKVKVYKVTMTKVYHASNSYSHCAIVPWQIDARLNLDWTHNASNSCKPRKHMSELVPHVSSETITTVFEAVQSLMGKKARFGLPEPVKHCEIAREGTRWYGKTIHFWITLCGSTIGLRVFERSSRPKRRVLNDLLAKNEPPTLCVYDHMRPEKIIHKVAQCIKTGLSRLRHGLINVLRSARKKDLTLKCDAGSLLPSICPTG